VTVLAFTPGEELLSGDAGGGLKLWSWPRGKLLLELDEHVGPVYTLGSSADGKLLASGAKDESICVWVRETGELLHRLPVGPRGGRDVVRVLWGRRVSGLRSRGQHAAVLVTRDRRAGLGAGRRSRHRRRARARSDPAVGRLAWLAGAGHDLVDERVGVRRR